MCIRMKLKPYLIPYKNQLKMYERLKLQETFLVYLYTSSPNVPLVIAVCLEVNQGDIFHFAHL